MAEKTEKKPEGGGGAEKKEAPKKEAAGAAPAAKAAAPAAPAGGGGLLSKTPVLLGGVMILEAVVLFAGFKFIGAGAHSANADMTTDKKDDKSVTDKPKTVEIELFDDRFPNKQSGRTFLYDVDIFVTVKTEDADKIKKQLTDNDALIRDRIRTIIAQSDPDKLNGGTEPGLETLRRQVKFQLEEIVGDGTIAEVLIPHCLPFRTDY